MNTSQLESIVIRAIDALRAGAPIEDDRIELKREWPPVEKARQLAGAANQAAGEYVVYVIGVDEKTKEIHSVDGTDPAAWWAKMETQFDEVPPDLVRHIAIQVSESERVVGLLFRTDRAPYVVKVAKDGSSELEVPIRSATRTRSAKRHELIRMLAPEVGLPQASVVRASLEIARPDPSGFREAQAELSLFVNVMFDHTASKPSFIPEQGIRVELRSGNILEDGKLRFVYLGQESSDSAVQVRSDGLRVAESGTVTGRAEWMLPRERADEYRALEGWTLRAVFPVLGASRSAIAEGDLRRRHRGPSMSTDFENTPSYAWTTSEA